MTKFLENNIFTAIEPVAQDLGFRIVDLTLKGSFGSRTLEVLAEDQQTKKMTIDDCAKLSREISTILDVEDIIEGKYRLEVSSPGIDRPLKSEQDFIDYIGFDAKIEIDPPSNSGQKRFRGIINKFENDEIFIETDQGEVALPYKSVHKAKLVLTDRLINATKREN